MNVLIVMSTSADNTTQETQGPGRNASAKDRWYVKKSDDNVYGPESVDVLLEWAAECRIVIGNQVSQDRKHWIPAEDLPQLKMDWVAELPDGRRYGPFNVLATRELCDHDVLPMDTVLKHVKTGETITVEEQLAKQPGHRQDVLFGEAGAPAGDDSGGASSRRRRTQEKAAKRADAEPADEPSAELIELREAHAELEKRVKQQDKRLRRATVELEEAQAKLASTFEQYETERAAWRAQIESLETASAPSGAPAEGELSESTGAEIDGLNAELESKDHELAELRKRLDASERARRDLEDTADKREQELLEQIDATHETIADLRQQLESREAAAHKQHAVAGMITKLEQLLHEEKERSAELAEQLKRSEAERGRGESRALAERTDLENKYSRARRQVSAMDNALRQWRQRVSILSVMSAILLVLLIVFACALSRSRRRAAAAVVATNGGRERVELPVVMEGDRASTPGERHEAAPAPQARAPAPAPAVREASPSTPPASSELPDIRVAGIRAVHSGRRCTLTFEEPVFSSLTAIAPAALVKFGQLAAALKGNMGGLTLTIQGHTDDTPLKASRLYPNNEALGLERAKVVSQLLIEKFHLPAASLRAVSAGDRNPPYPNNSPENRRKNRTVVLILDKSQP